MLFVTWLQTRTDPQMLGRVMSLVMLNAVGLTPFSFAISGAVVDLGTTPLFLGAAVPVGVLTVRVSASRALREWD